MLKIPENLLNDTLIVSYLGYETAKIPLSALFSGESPAAKTAIGLQPKPFQIQEVKVRPLSASQVLEKAFGKVPENFSQRNVELTAFYREHIREDGKNIQFVEAVLGIYHTAYVPKPEKDQIKIIKGRQYPFSTRSWIWEHIEFVEGPFEMITADIAKNPKSFISVSQSAVLFSNPRHYKHYTYTLSQAGNFYVVEFSPRPKRRRALYAGRVLIDKTDWAFRRFEFWIAPERLNKAVVLKPLTQIYLEKLSIAHKVLNFRTEVNYKKTDEHWFLSDVEIEYDFELIELPYRDKHTVEVSQIFVVTDISRQTPEKYPVRERVERFTSLIWQIGKYDPDFWKNYNFVK